MSNNAGGPAVSSTRLLGVVHPTYALSEYWRSRTWSQWKHDGGCGLFGMSNGTVCQKLGKLDARTLGEIEDAWAPAGRELARYAETRMSTPSKGITETSTKGR